MACGLKCKRIMVNEQCLNPFLQLLIFYPFYLVFTWFLPEKHFGPLLRSYKPLSEPVLEPPFLGWNPCSNPALCAFGHFREFNIALGLNNLGFL